MKNLKPIFVLSLLLATPLIQAAETVTLKVAHFLPALSNAQRNVIEPWCTRLNQQSDNRIRCQIYPSMQLGGIPSQLPDQVRRGIADIVWTAPGYSPGRFPRSEAVELPFMLPANGELGSKIIWDFYEKTLKDDYSDYKVLALHSDGGMQLHNVGASITKLSEFKGQKIRASTRMTASLLDALGATPVSMPPAQLTESLSKGVINGALVGWEVIPALKLEEITRHHSEPQAGQPIFSTTLLSFLMNKKRYESLPDDLREIIDRNSGLELSTTFGASWDKEADRARQIAIDLGASVSTITADDYQRMRAAADTARQRWIAESAEKGIDGNHLAKALEETAKANGFNY
ncbi:MAG: TRAP transporter substrate-binding protein [Pseudomonas sp.]|uniref:TRAP transporter substrate-binding protein n=1 Tax=Pseudomonas sp. TaxID=306 RepID=UPI003981E91A